MKLLVLLHLYYHDQLPYFLEKLSHINGCDYDLTVTYSTPLEESFAALKAFKPDCTLIQVPNAGYDVWPFIYALKCTDLDRYDLLLKLHTKNIDADYVGRINGLSVDGALWRDLLVDPLLGSDSRFASALGKFESNPRCGIVYGTELRRHLSAGLREDKKMLFDELQRLGVRTRTRWFCAGTMFIARVAPYKILQTDIVYKELFDGKMHSHSVASMSHVY